jgi:uncharacterized protein (DUF952 family)
VKITYHGTPRDYFDSLDPETPYIPAEFERDGFIHCTDGAEAASITLTTYYQNTPGDWVMLYIDKKRVTVPVRYEDPAEVFPHIYGPLNRDAIVAVKPIERSADGTFMRPPPL